MKLTCWLFLLLLSTQVLYVLAIEGSSALRGLSTTDGSTQDWKLARDMNHSISSVSNKSGKGKGAFGGANDVHRPNPRASAAPALLSPPFVISLLIMMTLGFVYAA